MIKIQRKREEQGYKSVIRIHHSTTKNANNETKRIHYGTYKTDIVQDSRSLFLARFHQYI